MRSDIVMMTDVIGQLAGLDKPLRCDNYYNHSFVILIYKYEYIILEFSRLPFATAVTNIWFLSSMLTYMSNERTGLCEAFSANQTQAGLFTLNKKIQSVKSNQLHM